MPVAPSRDDPVVASLSEAVGGPAGRHGGSHPWWTPVRVVLALTALTVALGMVQKSSCFADNWNDTEQRYTHMCYSDLPYLYTGRGFVEGAWPYDEDPELRGRYNVMEYPVGISYFAYGTAWLTQRLTGAADVVERGSVPTADLWSDPQVQREVRGFVVVNAVFFAGLALLAAWFLAGVHRRRPWDAAAFALAPVLALTGLVNWDLLAVLLVAAALWAWARGRPLLTGVLIGLGTATKLYPLFLLGGILVICVRQRRWGDLVRACGAALAGWALANLPAIVSGPSAWRVFWQFNSERGADLGSIWLVLSQAADTTFDAHTINLWSWGFLLIWCVGVLVIGLRAPQTPRLAQLGFLVVAGFLLVNKVYSPQYVLWLLPLAVLARPRWRDLLIWQATEVFYFAAVWWYLGGLLAPAAGEDAGFYWLAIVVRMAGELYLVGVVVRDVLRPAHDPVREERQESAVVSARR